jgi:hypothetical protein
MYSQMLVGMVALTGQWWLDAQSPSKDEVAAHMVNLAWNGLSGLEHQPRLMTRRGYRAARQRMRRPSPESTEVNREAEAKRETTGTSAATGKETSGASGGDEPEGPSSPPSP